jgi:lipopolysaccharide/colanic/teichoic acid biosynthesis glycosyltransferase
MKREPAQVIFREKTRYIKARRVIDFTLALAVTALASPIVALAAVAIKLEDRGPVFFLQRRVGRFGRCFTIYKLRTMAQDQCGDALSPTKAGDSRITRVGRILRKTSIDELPQLLNVLRGDMALVGPRPEMPFVVDKYERWQHMRHLATPGITGLWQATCRSNIPLHKPEATLIDLQHVTNSSHRADFGIILKTISSLIKPRGAY